MKFQQWPKRDPDKKLFQGSQRSFSHRSQLPGDLHLLLSAEHRGQRNLPVLPQLQDHRQGAGYE